MTKFVAAVHEHESLLGRRARLNAAGGGASRDEPKARAAEPTLEGDMLDLVTKFEENYAELAPAPEEHDAGAVTDDLFADFPERPFDAPAPRNRARTLELARFEPQGARESAPVFAASTDARSEADEQVEIDEAFSILKAAETKGAAKAQRAAEDAQALAADMRMAPGDVKPEPRSTPRANAGTERVDWASRTRKPRIIALAGGVVILALGLTLGFIAGRSPHGKPPVTIQTSDTGGTVLRLDRNLGNR